MQIRRPLAGGVLALGAWLSLPAVAHAQIGVQRERNVPDAYAITNARIVPVAGAPIARGTVVVRHGLIESVGATVTPPADAQIVDGTGLTVYPGFIDPYSDLGLATPAAPVGGRGGAAPGGARQQGATDTGAPNSLHPAGLQPELAAIDLLKVSESTFTGPQSAGYTTALVAPSTGIFQGQAALIELTNDEPQRILLRAPIALDIGFRPVRGGGYPGSLLGVFSSMRQMLLDAQHYGAEQAAYAANPHMTRPAYDASLEALQPVLARKEPVIMRASTEREIERALDMAKEFGLRPIISGGAESDQLIDRLKSEHVPVLLSLDFPRRPVASPDADPEPLRVLRARVDAPKVAGKLAAAGVDFAFDPSGITNWPDVLANARHTVDAGLPADQAIRAMTLAPAQILGVADRLGSIEPGKIANLTLVKGDALDRNGVVTEIFVDGRPTEIPAPPAPAARGGRGGNAAASTAVTATGTWTITISLGGQDVPATLTLQQQGQNLTGTVQGSFGTSQVASGSCSATGDIQFSTSGEVNGQTVEANFTGTIKGNSMQGNVSVNGMGDGTFIGTRPDAGGARGTPPESR